MQRKEKGINDYIASIKSRKAHAFHGGTFSLQDVFYRMLEIEHCWTLNQSTDPNVRKARNLTTSDTDHPRIRPTRRRAPPTSPTGASTREPDAKSCAAPAQDFASGSLRSLRRRLAAALLRQSPIFHPELTKENGEGGELPPLGMEGEGRRRRDWRGLSSKDDLLWAEVRSDVVRVSESETANACVKGFWKCSN